MSRPIWICGCCAARRFSAPASIAPGRTDTLIDAYDVRPRDPDLAAGALSGGNLQKLVIARELSGHSRASSSPATRPWGLDLIAADAVRQRMFAHAAQGCAVLWMSEDLDDLLQYAHRIAVLFNGRLMGVVSRDHASRDRIRAADGGNRG